LAYILTGILTVLLYLSQVFKYMAYRLVNSFIFQLKNGLTMLLYNKISKLTAFVIRSEDVGKIINLLANDFAVLEQRGTYLLSTATFPILFIGNVILLVIKIGWPTLLGTIIILLTVILLTKYS